jgi:hypothetical protein
MTICSEYFRLAGNKDNENKIIAVMETMKQYNADTDEYLYCEPSCAVTCPALASLI